jgi:hypothetical protein
LGYDASRTSGNAEPTGDAAQRRTYYWLEVRRDLGFGIATIFFGGCTHDFGFGTEDIFMDSVRCAVDYVDWGAWQFAE